MKLPVAAIAGTAATAGCGRIHTLSMESPSITFPAEPKRKARCGSFASFFKRRNQGASYELGSLF